MIRAEREFIRVPKIRGGKGQATLTFSRFSNLLIWRMRANFSRHGKVEREEKKLKMHRNSFSNCKAPYCKVRRRRFIVGPFALQNHRLSIRIRNWPCYSSSVERNVPIWRGSRQPAATKTSRSFLSRELPERGNSQGCIGRTRDSGVEGSTTGNDANLWKMKDLNCKTSRKFLHRVR